MLYPCGRPVHVGRTGIASRRFGWEQKRHDVPVIVGKLYLSVERLETPVDDPQTDSLAVLEGGFGPLPENRRLGLRNPFVGVPNRNSKPTFRRLGDVDVNVDVDG